MGWAPEAFIGNVLQEVCDTAVPDTTSSYDKQTVSQLLVAQPAEPVRFCGMCDHSRLHPEEGELKIADQSPGVWLTFV